MAMRTATARRRRVAPIVWPTGAASSRAIAPTGNRSARAARRPASPWRAATSASTLEADVDVVVVVGERERRAAEAEQGDDLLRLQLGGQAENRLHGALGPAAELLVTVDRRAPNGGDVRSK